MMQEVAADQAIMQLMDARGTLMELKVSLLHKLADFYLLPAVGRPKCSAIAVHVTMHN